MSGAIAGATNVLESHSGQDSLSGPLGVLVGQVGKCDGILDGLQEVGLNLVVRVVGTVSRCRSKAPV